MLKTEDMNEPVLLVRM